jgi:hypothetical protein
MKFLKKVWIALLLLPLLLAVATFGITGVWDVYLILGWYSACVWFYVLLFLGNLFFYIRITDIHDLAEMSRNLQRAWLERDEAKRKADKLETKVKELEAQHN